MATEHHQPAPQEEPQHGEMQHGGMVGMKMEDMEHSATKGGDHAQMALDFRKKWLWIYTLNIIFGVLILFSPFTFGYTNTPLMWSDLISGALTVVIGIATLFSVRLDFLGRWSLAFIGLWLNFAPLAFWTKSPAAYLSGTTIDTLLVAFAVLVPMMPGMAHHMAMMKPGPVIPPGWRYTPSSWHQRAPIAALALFGWLIARYMAAYQLGHITSVYDPIFGDGTRRVLGSQVSKMWPVSDAGLGAFSYTLEVLMAFMGGPNRWRTMPWMSVFFFILVVPLGITSVVLIMLQPVAVGAWCGPCLLTGVLMLAMVPLAVDEVVATIQFLQTSIKNGKPFWRTFWVGDTIEGGAQDERSPEIGEAWNRFPAATAWGVTLPWNIVASIFLGAWLMAAPGVLGSTGTAAGSDNIAGALVVTIAFLALAEVTRAARFLNVLLGAWVIAAPWLLVGVAPSARWNDLLIGALIIALSFPRGKTAERYGGWQRFIV
jgi:hypothetical protein